MTGAAIVTGAIQIVAGKLHEITCWMFNQFPISRHIIISSLQESRCLLGLFIGSIVVLLACMIGGLVLAAGGDGIENIRKALEDSVKEYDPNAEAGSRPQEITAAWDQIQTDYECCGVSNYTDWVNLNDNFNEGSIEVPPSCCLKANDDAITACQRNPEDNNLVGCYQKFGDTIEQHETAILVVISGILVVMVRNINKRNKRRNSSEGSPDRRYKNKKMFVGFSPHPL